MSELGKPDLNEILTTHELDQLYAAIERSGRPHCVDDYKLVVNWAMRIRIENAVMVAVMQGYKALFIRHGEVMLTDNAPAT